MGAWVGVGVVKGEELQALDGRRLGSVEKENSVAEYSSGVGFPLMLTRRIKD